MMLEAMRRLHWEEFTKWVDAEDYGFRLECLNSLIREMLSEIETTRHLSDIDQPRLQEKLEVILSFITWFRRFCTF